MSSVEHIVLEFHAIDAEYERATLEYLRVGARGVADSADVTVRWNSALRDNLRVLSDEKAKFVTLEDTGRQLTDILRPAGWDEDERRIRAALREGRRVVVTFCSNAPELYGLPWSTLKVERAGALGSIRGLILHYTRPRKSPPRPRGLGQVGGQVLLASSVSGGDVPAQEHEAAIRAACERADVGFEVKNGTSLQWLSAALGRARSDGRPFRILHLLCHGIPLDDEGDHWGLALHHDGAPDKQVGNPAKVNAVDLADALAAGGDDLGLVVLSTCHSAASGDLGSPVGSVAATLHEHGIPAVVASQFPLSVSGSNAFTEALYERMLVHLDSLEDAYRAAAAAAGNSGTTLDRYSLQLFVEMDGLFDHRPIVQCPDGGPLGATPGDGRFLYGRAEEVHRLVEAYDRLPDNARLLFVTGEIGAGKSTAVLSGLLPRLLRRPAADLSWDHFCPGADPIGELDRCVARRAGDGPWLLIVDQLEELFTHVEDEAVRVRFLERLQSLATSPTDPVTVVATLRTDLAQHVAQVEPGEGYDRLEIVHEDRHRVHLPRLGRGQLRDLVRDALARVGLHANAYVAEILEAELLNNPDGLHQLAFVLQKLWDHRGDHREIGPVYRALDRDASLVDARADSVLDDLSENDRREALTLVANVAALGERITGQRHRWRLLQRLVPSAPDRRDPFHRALHHLLDHRLVVLRDSPHGRRVELANESLETRWEALKHQVAAQQAKFDDLRLLERHLATLKHPDAVLRGGDLDHAEDLLARYRDDLDDRSIARIEASIARDKADRLAQENELREAAESRARNTTWLAIAATIVAIAVSGLGWTAYTSSKRAQEEALAARDASRMLEVELHASDRDRAAQVLREVEQPGTAAGWLHEVYDLLASPVPLATYRLDGVVQQAHLLADGRMLARTLSGRVYLFGADLDDEGLVLHETARFVAVAADEGEVALGLASGAIARLSLDDPDRVQETESLSLGAIRSLHFLADGGLLVHAGETAAVVSRDGGVRELAHGGGDVTAVAVERESPGRIVSGDTRGRVRLWSNAGDGLDWLTPETTAEDRIRTAVHSLFFVSGVDPVLLVDVDGVARWVAATPEGDGVLAKDRPEKRKLLRIARVSSDGRWLLRSWGTNATDSKLVVSSTDGTDSAQVLGGHADIVRNAAFCADSRLLITASDDSTARVWRLQEGQWQYDGMLHNVASTPPGDDDETWGALNDVSLSPGGDRVALASTDHTATLWETSRRPQASRVQQLLPPDGATRIARISFSSHGESVAVRWNDDQVTLHDLSTDAQPQVPPTALFTARDVDHLGSGSQLVLIDEGKHLHLWPRTSPGEGSTQPIESNDPAQLGFKNLWCASDHATCVLRAEDDRLYVLGDDLEILPVLGLPEKSGRPLSCAFDEHGTRAAVLYKRSIAEVTLGPTPELAVSHPFADPAARASLVAYGDGDGSLAVAWTSGDVQLNPHVEEDLVLLEGHEPSTVNALTHGSGVWVSAGDDGCAKVQRGPGARPLILGSEPECDRGGSVSPDPDAARALTLVETPAGEPVVVTLHHSGTLRWWPLGADAMTAELGEVARRPMRPPVEPERQR